MTGVQHNSFGPPAALVCSKPAGRKPRYKPVLNPESLLLPPVRVKGTPAKVELMFSEAADTLAALMQSAMHNPACRSSARSNHSLKLKCDTQCPTPLSNTGPSRRPGRQPRCPGAVGGAQPRRQRDIARAAGAADRPPTLSALHADGEHVRRVISECHGVPLQDCEQQCSTAGTF